MVALDEDRVIGETGHISDHNRLHDWYNDWTNTDESRQFVPSDFGTYGDTASRPTTALTIGRRHFDVDLNMPVWYDGVNWVDANGIAATATSVQEYIRDTIAAALVAGSGIGIAVDDTLNTITLT